jgi:hypothetical protein
MRKESGKSPHDVDFAGRPKQDAVDNPVKTY